MPGVSRTSLRHCAAISASADCDGAASHCTPAKADLSNPPDSAKPRQRSVVTAGRKASAINRTRAVRSGPAPPSGQSITSARVASSFCNSKAMPCWGWVASSITAPQSSSARTRSSPGRTTMPWGKVATVAIRCAVAGMDPVDPAAMTGWVGGDARHNSAWDNSRRLRRSAGSIRPLSAKCAGHALRMIFRKSSVTPQWSAYSSGTSPSSRSRLSPSV